MVVEMVFLAFFMGGSFVMGDAETSIVEFFINTRVDISLFKDLCQSIDSCIFLRVSSLAVLVFLSPLCPVTRLIGLFSSQA
jgi:hypothetical protein